MGHVPCQLHPGEVRHIFHVNPCDPLRLRCSNRQCFHKLVGERLWNYLASFFKRGGPIPRSALHDITRPRLQPVVEIPVTVRRRRPIRQGGQGFLLQSDSDDNLYEDNLYEDSCDDDDDYEEW